MKKVFVGSFFVLALALSACTQTEAPKTAAPSPAPIAIATPAPVEAPAVTGDLGKAKVSLEKALADYKAKNYPAAIAAVDAAHKEVAAMSANAPALLKSGLETAGKGIESAKGLIEKKDAGTEKTLTGLIASVSKLADTAKTAAGSGLAGAAAAAGSMVKDAAKGAAEKKPAEKK